MTVAEIIDRLRQLPPDAEVFIHYDGAARGQADGVWLTQAGTVSIGPAREPVYYDADRSHGAVSATENPYLEVGEMLSIPSEA